eukprot:gb/GEZJ01003119.1/.p1 GENE.gb/GEZJ01003119.1/~~gb/GEZJ01003119.1/.p1  ORF type:complete len:1200 (+),score=196.93 gb/GEZJ01003119.1/:290-3889(+)
MSYTSLSGAKSRADLQNSISDSKQFEKALADCFVDGSRAAAETASIFLCKEATTAIRAKDLGNAVKTLPNAVSTENAEPLAYASAFLATGFDDDRCKEPLRAFSFTRREVKMEALRAVTDLMAQKLAVGKETFSTLLHRVGSILLESTSDVSEMDLYVIVKGVTSLSDFVTEESKKEILSFALDLCDGRSPYIQLDGVRPLSPRFQGLYITDIVRIADDVYSTSRILSRCLISCLEFGDATAFETLWDLHSEWVLDALELSGFDLAVFSLSIVTGQLALRGNLRACARAMGIVLQLVKQITRTASRVTTFVSLFISSVFQAVGSIGIAVGAEQLAKAAAYVIRLAKDMASGDDSLRTELLSNTDEALREAARRKWPASALVLGVLRKLIISWKSSKSTEDWIRGDFEVLVKESAGLFDSDENGVGGVNSLAQDSKARDTSQDVESDKRFVDLPAFVVLGTLFVLMRHENSRIRFVSLQLLRRVRKESLFVFYFPSVMMLLQEERNGLIVAGFLREILTSPGLMSSMEASNVAFSTLMRLSRSHINSEVYGTVLVAFAWASEYAPSIGIRLLARELETLKSSFDSVRAQIRTAAAAAVHKLAEVRPSRCVDLIPFISLCITPKSMEVAPQATSLCFDVMCAMAKEEVLDPIKAVKVVMKSFPSAANVRPQCRRSYLKLLGVAAGGEGGKKRQRMMQMVTKLLRSCLTELSPAKTTSSNETTSCLSWGDVQQAALSLTEFTAEEILRSAFLDDEPLIGLEEEKKRLDKIDASTAQFIQGVLMTSDCARLNDSRAANALEMLVEKIVLHEWKTRKKSSFDPERVGKLRATSEALRRARKAQGLIQEEDLPPEDQARTTFLGATTSFPIGVIRSVFQFCVDEQQNTGTSKGVNYKPSGMAMRVITNTKIASPALPWVSMIEEVLCSKETEPSIRASCLAILRGIRDNSFELNEKKSKWFGSQCPLFGDKNSIASVESKQLFLGMAELFPSDLGRLLRHSGKGMSDNMIEELIRSCEQISEDGEGLQVAVEGLFRIICDRERHFDDHFKKKMEHMLVEMGLRRCQSSAALDMIMNTDSSNPSVIRIASEYGNFQSVSYAVQGLFSEAHGNSELAEAVGRAVRQLPFSQRRDVVMMMFGSKTFASEMAEKEMFDRAIEVSAHALMVGGLVPGGKELLYASLCTSRKHEQEMIQRLLSYIFSVIKR